MVFSIYFNTATYRTREKLDASGAIMMMLNLAIQKPGSKCEPSVGLEFEGMRIGTNSQPVRHFVHQKRGRGRRKAGAILHLTTTLTQHRI